MLSKKNLSKKTKLFTILFVFIFFSQFSVFSKEKNDFITVGISSGFPLYEDSAKIYKEEISTPSKLIIGTFANINIPITNQAKFFAGFNLFADFCWNVDNYHDFLNFDFPIGFMFSPKNFGLNFGLAYTLGGQLIMYKIENTEYETFSPFGNGFKLIVEYDFSVLTEVNILPAIGFSWTFLPRGKNQNDNLFAIYISESF